MSHGSERSGILLALAGFALLSVGDAVVKTMAGAWSPLAVAALRFVIGAVGLSALLWRKEGAQGFRAPRPWLQVARGIGLAGATLCFFCAIFVMPLAETVAIAFVAPVLVALLAPPLLGERTRPVTYLACAIALVGVAIVLRPNLAEVGWVALLPLGSATFFALMVIANRASAGLGRSALAMQAYIAVLAAPILVLAALGGHLSGAALLQVGMPDASVVLRCALVAVTASTAHWLTYLATMRAGAATIAPTTYIQILVATLLGWWWFGDVPDPMTLAGAGVIIAAGLVLWWSTPHAGEARSASRERDQN